MVISPSRIPKPNFLCIGAQKAGTTWLDANLREHPQVWLPPVKELHYFDQVYLNNKFIEIERLRKLHSALGKKINGKEVDQEYLHFLVKFALPKKVDDHWYTSLFEGTNSYQSIGDITPAYSALPDEGVGHIRALLGDIKIIFIMRNPVQRMWSAARMRQKRDLRRGRPSQMSDLMRFVNSNIVKRRTDYKKTIHLFQKHFDRQKILYLFYDQIKLDPINFLICVCNFLEIDPDTKYFEDTAKKIFHRSKKSRIPEELESYLSETYKPLYEWVINEFSPNSFEL